MEELNQLLDQLKNLFIEKEDVQSLSLLVELQRVIFSAQSSVSPLFEVSSHMIEERLSEGSTKITFQQGCYYKGTSGPYCPRCWESEDQWILMEVMPRKVRKKGAAHCPNCDVVLLHTE